jgi:ubiquinone/menaquinone biosynthesis C-methylase UbiE
MENVTTDTRALLKRLSINQQAKHSLEDWIFEQVHCSSSMRVADLGCGTGQQIFYLVSRLTESSRIVGLDISTHALEIVQRRAGDAGVDYVETVCGDIDDTPTILKNQQFDLILSSYAAYYSSDIGTLIDSLRPLLATNGQLFLCGPGRGTNSEFRELVNQFVGYDLLIDRHGQDFIDDKCITQATTRYSSSTTSRLDNSIPFTSPDQVMEWWANHLSFDESIKSIVTDAMTHYYSSHSILDMTKNVFGIKFNA